uniref:Endoplasmic reticulum transmembrane protein n=1 Tax=Pararge aegeria TaxID=116150 RepID=S4NYA5_9NEOP
MSLQWTFIAGFLYFEIFLIVLMLVPLFSAKKWYNFFRSRFFQIFHEKTAIYFYGWAGVLCLFLFDSIREMMKYSHSSVAGHVHLASDLKGSVKLFRAQRNFYITSFSIFLAFVIRRLVVMIIYQYELEIKTTKLMIAVEDKVKKYKTTVNSLNTEQENTLEVCKTTKNKLELVESSLEEQKSRVKELEEEATMWRLKYEELKNTIDGHGDN